LPSGANPVKAAQRPQGLALTARERHARGCAARRVHPLQRMPAGAKSVMARRRRKVGAGDTATGWPLIFREPPLAGADGCGGCEHGNEQRSASRAQQTPRGGRGLVPPPCAQRLAKPSRWRDSASAPTGCWAARAKPAQRPTRRGARH